MEVITLTKKQIHNQGQFGLYFRTSQREGIKISKDSGYQNPILNLNSKKNQKIIKEATIGLLAGSATKDVVLVTYMGKFYLGIRQRHITGKFDQDTNISKVKRSLNSKQIIHGDLHYKNIIINKHGPNVIDFDPCLSYFVGPKPVYYTVKNRIIKKIKKNLAQA